MKYGYMGEAKKINITVVVTREELNAIDAYLKPLCGSRGPFIRQLVLEKVGFKPENAEHPTEESQ